MKLLNAIISVAMIAAGNLSGNAEIYTIQANDSQPVITSFNLSAGQDYLVQASGTFIYNVFLTDGNTFQADAEWSWNQETKDGTWIERWPDPNSPDYFMDLTINGQGVDWLGTSDPVPGPNSVFSGHTYSPSHVYQTTITGQGTPLSFVIYDVPYYYDNTGSLSVTISAVPEPKSVGILSLGLLSCLLLIKRTSRAGAVQAD